MNVSEPGALVKLQQFKDENIILRMYLLYIMIVEVYVQ